MSKVEWFRQCKLTRKGKELASTHTTVWVPEKLAVEGKRLRFKEDEPDGPVWAVEAAYSQRMDQVDLDNRRDALKRFQGVLVNA